MSTDEPDDVGGLNQQELKELLRELLAAEGKDLSTWADGSEEVNDDEGWLVEEDGRSTLYVAEAIARMPVGRIQRLAQTAAALGAERLVVVVTGRFSAGGPGLNRLLDQLRGAFGIEIELVDAPALIERVSKHEQLRARFFPSREEAEQAAEAQDIPALVLDGATAIARLRGKPKSGTMTPYVRVGWTVGAVMLFISLPINVSPYQARCVGAMGLGLIILAIVLAQIGKRRSGPHAGPTPSVMDTLIPVEDEMAIRRNVTLYGHGPAAMTFDFLRAIPEELVRRATGTGVVLFLAAFSFLYLLVWGIDPASCEATSTACTGAYSGVGERAAVGDLVHLAVQAAFFNVPDDVAPASGFARGLVGSEFILSALLLVSYARIFGLQDAIRDRQFSAI